MAESYTERHFEDSEWEKRWQRFQSAIEKAAEEGTSADFAGIELNYDLMSEEEKRRSVEVWEKIQSGSITWDELMDYQKFMGDIIEGVVKGAGLSRKEMFGLTRYGIDSYLVNKGMPIVARKRLEERRLGK